jgi:benzoate/toluate 1,2-dioxygenase subunit alpha
MLSPHDILGLIDDRPEDGVFRVHRRVFTDPDVFDLEMKAIFEGGWVFLGLASQVPQPNDYFTTTIGRHPIAVMRAADGSINAFVNSCPHKGARICQLEHGNARLHVCPYHSWSFDSAGRNRAIKGRAQGAYSEAFDRDSHDLRPVARFGDYRGLLFASLSPDVGPLEAHLAEARPLIDLIVDQSPEGVELVPGAVSFTFDANWKMQLENCSDQYHFSSVHPSYLRILERRTARAFEGATQNMWSVHKAHEEVPGEPTGGTYSFDQGHVLNWRMSDVPEALPLHERREDLARAHGTARRDWMFHSRNLTIFPNVQFAENASSQLRIIRPIAVGLTEMRTWCFAPIGESAEARRRRIRQYEDFFNPSGLATPDDAVVYEACQEGNASQGSPWLQGYGRGMCAGVKGPDRFADQIGLKPSSSVAADRWLSDETIFHAYYRAWRDRLAAMAAVDSPPSTGSVS